MRILGLQGSPRVTKKGNTRHLLSAFLAEAEAAGVQTEMIDICKLDIQPCKELIVCEKKGYCPIDDDMKTEIYPRLREADVIVLASPIFFYNVTAQLKALIDRGQTLWARRYKLGLTDPKAKIRKGVLLAVGATRGKNLFEGTLLTAKYFFDAVSADFTEENALTYRRVENPGDMAAHPDYKEEIQALVRRVISPIASRPNILFACRENACRSQMAEAFAQSAAGEAMWADSAGSAPADSVNPIMVEVMAEKGFDMAFRTPKPLARRIEETKPDAVITMGCGEDCPYVPGARREDWDLPDPAGKDADVMRAVRDEIETRVARFISDFGRDFQS